MIFLMILGRVFTQDFDQDQDHEQDFRLNGFAPMGIQGILPE
jgi:hypothetical protein